MRNWGGWTDEPLGDGFFWLFEIGHEEGPRMTMALVKGERITPFGSSNVYSLKEFKNPWWKRLHFPPAPQGLLEAMGVEQEVQEGV